MVSKRINWPAQGCLRGSRLDYPSNEAALQSSGLVMANPNQASRPSGPAEAVMGITLLDGKTPGCLLIKFDRPEGTIQNLIRFTTDPTLDPKHWEVAVGGGREREIGTFPPGTKVYVMAAALTGSTTEPVYSAVVSRFVQ